MWIAPSRSPETFGSGIAGAGVVSQIDDLSGNGNDLSQGTESNQPTRTRSDSLVNEVKDSENFESSTWTKQNGITMSDGAVANPIDGVTSASKCTSDGTTGGRIFTSWSLKRTGQFTAWAWFKDGTAPSSGPNSVQAGSASYTVTENEDDTISVGNGWNIHYQVFTVTGSGTSIEIYFYPCSNGFAAIDSGEFGYIFGASLAEGDLSGEIEDRAYVKTTGTLAYPGVNNRPGLRFDTTNDLIQSTVAFNSAEIFGATQKTMFVAFRTGASTVSNKRVLVGVDSGAGSSWGMFLGSSNTMTWRYRNNSATNASLSGSALGNSTVYVTALRHDGASVKGYVNSLTAAKTASDANTSAETSTSKMDVGNTFGGEILEVVVSNGRALTDGEFNRTMRYLAAKHDVTLN